MGPGCEHGAGGMCGSMGPCGAPHSLTPSPTELPTGPYRLAQLHAVLSQLSAPTLVLLRYLFAFLNQ